jgi:hypothetical protein
MKFILEYDVKLSSSSLPLPPLEVLLELDPSSYLDPMRRSAFGSQKAKVYSEFAGGR